MFFECIKNIKENTPLIHNITNYVTVNDVANVLLACGASPIMADDEMEVNEITSICDGLCINIGTLNRNTIKSMLLAGKESQKLGHINVLDPVGAGASKLRTNTACELVREIKFDVIRGNISEIKALFLNDSNTKGVDANAVDAVTDNSLDKMIEFTKTISVNAGSIIAITGEIDLVSDGDKCYVIRNGNAMMSKVTGTGCQLTALITAFVAANKEHKLEAVVSAVCMMGLAGEIAFDKIQENEGNLTYRDKIIDTIFNMDDEMLRNGAKYEVY